VREKLESLVTEMVEKGILLDEAVGVFEKKFIQAVLTQTRGNQSRAAEILGVHRNTLSRKIGIHKLNGKR
jgi:DNA-binding protein Fis